MNRTAKGASVFAITAAALLATAGIAGATDNGESEPAPPPAEPSCIAAIVGGTLADPAGTLMNTLADPGGTVTGVVDCVGTTLGLA